MECAGFMQVTCCGTDIVCLISAVFFTEMVLNERLNLWVTGFSGPKADVLRWSAAATHDGLVMAFSCAALRADLHTALQGLCGAEEEALSVSCMTVVWDISAVFLGLLLAVVIIFILKLMGVGSLWYRCKGGENVTEEFQRETRRFNRQLIDGAEKKIRLDAEAVLKRLRKTMQTVSYLLFSVIPRTEAAIASPGRDYVKEEMVASVSEIGIDSDSLVVSIVDLAQNILGMARSVYEEPSSPESGFTSLHGPGTTPNEKRPMPMGEITIRCMEMASDSAGVPSEASRSEININGFATQARDAGSHDENTIKSCCSVVISTCNLENRAVTEEVWPTEPEHPGGMIGLTYNILLAYDGEIGKNSSRAVEFKEKFIERADIYHGMKVDLRKRAETLKKEVSPPNGQDLNSAATLAAQYLGEATELLQCSTTLVDEASNSIKNWLPS